MVYCYQQIKEVCFIMGVLPYSYEELDVDKWMMLTNGVKARNNSPAVVITQYEYSIGVNKFISSS